MKKICCSIGLFFCVAQSIFGQGILVFKGTVKCFVSDDERSTKGAKNVVVVPGFIPKKSGMTGDQGYYEINTGFPIRKFEDKYVVIYYISSCKQCEKKESVFVSSEQATANRAQTLSYITIPTIKMNAGCKTTELDPLKADNTLNSFVGQPGEDIDKVSALNVVAAPPGLLNLLTNVVSIQAAASGAANSKADTKLPRIPGNIGGYGRFLFASPMRLTANTGFNFAPFRDRSEAVFWNPATLANSSHPGGLDLFMNLKNNFKLSGYSRVNDDITIGLGGIYTRQDQYRMTRYDGVDEPVPHPETLKEWAVFLSSAYKLSKKLSAGLTFKSIWQNFNVPDLMDGTKIPNTFIDSTISRQRFDADISLSYKISPSLDLGVNVMNITGAELYADAFAAGQRKISFSKLRSAGLGLCYKWRQFNFGTDILFAENGLYEVSAGINYVPFNNALLAAGVGFRQGSYSASFKWKQFKASYVDDNGLMVNEKNPGKSKVFNGRIYTGVVFDF